MTKAEAKAVTTMLAVANPSAPIPQETFDLYSASLERFPVAHVRAAAERVMLTSKWFPSLAELLAETVRVTDGLPDPEAAWLAALRWQRDGFPIDAKPHGAVMESIRASGGTFAMKQSPAHEWKRMFDAAYKAAHARAFERMLEETLPAIERETRKAIAAGTALAQGLLPKTASTS